MRDDHTKGILVAVGSVLAIVLVGFGIIVWIFQFRNVQTYIKKRSPDGKHTATVKRKQWIDVNVMMNVGGRRVYGSPDFRRSGADLAEQVIWHTNSQIVVLEIAGRRIFGYHAVEKRPLNPSEIQSVRSFPSNQFRFDGEVATNLEESTP